MAGTGIAKHFFRKYGVVIFFPTFTAATILVDLNHTRIWKGQQKLLVEKVHN